ncbi:MAG: GNAT family N-acetyltransferase [Cellvibrionaceae bacterium]
MAICRKESTLLGRIKIDDLQGPEIAALLQQHLDHMADLSPPESIHALDLAELKKPEITFWTLWSEPSFCKSTLMGCGALKELSVTHGEIKSMRTSDQHRRKGVGGAMLQHIIDEASNRNYVRLSLETGSMDGFKPALEMYKKFGFFECEPFAEYTLDVNSIFMTKML